MHARRIDGRVADGADQRLWHRWPSLFTQSLQPLQYIRHTGHLITASAFSSSIIFEDVVPDGAPPQRFDGLGEDLRGIGEPPVWSVFVTAPVPRISFALLL
jgi:hypothetical protein